MSILNNSLLLGADAAVGGYQIQRSLRFNSSDSAYCSRVPSTAGNRKTWTWAGWVKRSAIGSGNRTLFDATLSGGSTENPIIFGETVDDTLSFYLYNGTSYVWQLRTTQVFRDASAWYHILVAVDTTQSTASERVKFFVNGTQVTTFAVSNYPSQNSDTYINNNTAHSIGSKGSNVSSLYSGYLADIHFIDGQALTPSSFTEVSATTGQLVPKAYTGSFGTNGFWLKFSDNSAATATTLGKDYSGNNNNWTCNNLSVQGLLNYSSNVTTVATSIYNGTPATMFDGSISTFYGVTSNNGSNSSITIDLTGKGVSVSTGIRVYGSFRTGMVWQINGSTVSSSGVSHPNTGWQTLSGWSAGAITSISTSVPSGSANEIYAIEVNGVTLTNNNGAGNDSLVDTPTSYGTDTGAGGEVRGNYCTLNPLSGKSGVTLTNGNLDRSGTTGNNKMGTLAMSSGKWYWEITLTDVSGGVFLGVTEYDNEPDAYSLNYMYNSTGGKYIGTTLSSYGASYGASDVIGFAYDADNGSLVCYKNNSSQGTLVSGLSGKRLFPLTRSDGQCGMSCNFGQRQWAYAAPAGFKALCDTNLPAPVVAKPSEVMDVKLYTGNGSTQTISGLGFSPDLVWIKNRASTYGHIITDIVRGADRQLYPYATNAESTETTALTAFTSDGFSLGSWAPVNVSPDAHVAWCWDAGTTTTTNTVGSITSQVRANPSAGFSVVTFTGNGTQNATVGHGLGVAPALHFIKNRSSSSNWVALTTSINGSLDYAYLNSTAAFGDAAQNAPTSTVFSVWNDTDSNANGSNYVAYCFAPVAGYSSFGSYTGNGSADGPFVYTGMSPRWLLLKNASDGSANWYLYDALREAEYNPHNKPLFPDGSFAEQGDNRPIDLLSNGFKIRYGTYGWFNGNGNTIIYAAFAQNPFQYARAR